MRRALVVLALLVLGVAAFAALRGGEGCDGGDGRPECVAERFAASGDASKCDLVAPELLEELTGQRGAAARATCAENVARVGPRGDVRLLEREPQGGAVRVEVVAGGREGVMTLERRPEGWRITSFDE